MNKKLVELRKTLGKFISNFSVAKTEDGAEIIFDGDNVYEGLEVNTYNEKGEVVALTDGEYTINGVKVEVSNGKVARLIDKEKSELPKDGDKKDEPNDKPKDEPNDDGKNDEPTEVEKALKEENEALKAEVEALKAEVEKHKAKVSDLKKEVADLKKQPMANPVPQRTNMSSNERVEVSDNVKGTKFERVCNIFNS